MLIAILHGNTDVVDFNLKIQGRSLYFSVATCNSVCVTVRYFFLTIDVSIIQLLQK